MHVQVNIKLQLSVQVQVQVHAQVHVEVQVQVQVPAGRAGADLGVLFALFTDQVSVVTLEDPAWGHHHLHGGTGAGGQEHDHGNYMDNLASTLL